MSIRWCNLLFSVVGKVEVAFLGLSHDFLIEHHQAQSMLC